LGNKEDVELEMNLDKLKLDDLPLGEKRFVAELIASQSALYGAGFSAELGTLAQLADHFQQLNEWDNVALVRIGSGGRFEGAALGEAEFVLLTTGQGEHPYPLEYLDKLKYIIDTPLMGIGMVPYMPTRVEHKDLDGNAPFSYYPGNKTPYPGRILEAEWVAGNRRLLEGAKRRVFAEIKSNDNIVDGLRNAAADHAEICKTGLSRKVRQFDLETNTVYYNPAEKQHGMKYGVLRYIQTAISIEIFELLRRRDLPIDEIVDLSQSVEERIRYCFRKDWVSREDDLITAGKVYVQACDLQTEMKIQHSSKNQVAFSLEEGSLSEFHESAINAFQTRVLAE
jgi:hypothetical protein